MKAELSAEETGRYRRHLLLKGFGQASQLKLKGAHVLMIGAGGLGCPALLYLAAAGVGKITIVDPDKVELGNLQRQVLFGSEDLGQPKALVAARRLQALNPCIELVPLVDRFRRDNALELCRAAQVVIDGSDNFTTRYLANDACVLTDRPLVYGAIHQFEGQASVFNWRGGPTYRCLFPEMPAADSVPSCAQAGVLGVLPGLLGTIQATEAIKLITGLGTPLAGRLLMVNALDMQTRTVRLSALPQSRHITELPPDTPSCNSCVDWAEQGAAEEMEVRELAILLVQGPVPKLLDVRDEEERRLEGQLTGSLHLPLARLRAGLVPEGIHVADTIVVYCAAGVRSRIAQGLLAARGYARVINLKGGFNGWRDSLGGTQRP